MRPGRRDRRAHAGQLLVASPPARLRDPLHRPRNVDPSIVSHRVVVRTVQEVGPLVDVRRPGLLCLGPGVPVLDVSHPAGHQHAKDLLRRDLARVFGYHKVYQIVDIGQLTVAPSFE